ncbi:MAG: N-acetylmuramoyl-L-alanine amidase [Candidatus Tumulicola sp.]
MSWISRFIAPIFKTRTACAALLLAAWAGLPALAGASITAVYGQHTIRFTHVSTSAGATALGINDPGFATLLRDTGASLTWQPGDRYVLITTSVPTVVSFAVGDRRYDVGSIGLQAGIAPYQQGGEVYLPLNELLRSLDLALRQDGPIAVLQPQLAMLDVRSTGSRVDLVAHGGAPLRPRIVAQNANAVTYEFDGVGTALAGTRNVNAGGIRALQIVQTGTLRAPKTNVIVQLEPGAVYDAPRSNDERDVLISFAASAAAAQTPSSQAAGSGVSSAPAGSAAVTGVTVTPTADGYAVAIAVAGSAAFEWHRLRDPDNRFWVDVKGAQLQTPPIDQTEPDPVGALRVRQIDAATVRVALSLAGPKALAIVPSGTGLTVFVGEEEVASAPRAGTGSVGSVVASGEQAATVTPAPSDQSGDSAGGDNGWKFGSSHSTYVPKNPRLIVIDPGHGGSDPGSARNGVKEATLALDMAKRLRGILIARGWQVQMTHDADVDVYAPNDSAHDELQARDDIANNAGARLLISIHVNAFINSGPYGTTCYISKPGDVALARSIQRQLASDGTKDDGVIKSHLYVTLHALMPAVLVETAFLSNPNDFALLTSPSWRQKIAQSIADGIGQYDRQYPASNAPAQ